MRISGFSLVELSITLAILASLALFGIPISQQLIQKNRCAKIVAEIENAILTVRNKALIDNQKLLLLPLKDDYDWSKGMLLIQDNPRHKYVKSAVIMQQWQWDYPHIKVSWQGFISNHYLIFASHLSQSTLNGSFTVAAAKTPITKIIVNRLGHVKIT